MNRRNIVIFVVKPPISEFIDEEFKKRFGVERGINIYKDLTIKTYSKIKEDSDYMVILSYFFSKKFPDLRWLDQNEPGYLDVSDNDYLTAILRTADYAFRVGGESVVWINPLCPFIEKSDILTAFSNIKEKQLVIGKALNGGIYIFGINSETKRTISLTSPLSENDFDEILDKARKMRFTVFEMEPKMLVKDEESLRKWIESPDFDATIKIELQGHKTHLHKKRKETHSNEDQNTSSDAETNRN